ncbi:EamA family transporter [Arcanobacterium hippocoleae]|uniref:Inner membrane transporter RhtA n=1 Tax=Arcanobacterium hippocoleae TaxID=149017 RepID=A0ABU1T1X5_9ACTO|nr:EamA family transporter [Arcanobacterium hippocoleae]MDR6939348.1 inner membrane transporter RhtA [Arcanobacterium hippocoleae]
MKKFDAAASERVFGMFAPLTMIAAAIMNYAGTAFAVGLFDVASVTAVGWGRFATASLIMIVIFRPKIELKRIWVPILFGLAMTSMNLVFYHAIAHIPLGAAVALEFLGPVILSAVTARGWRVRTGLVLAVCGVGMISWVGVDIANRNVQIGVLLALAAGIFWAIYMYLGGKIAASGKGSHALTIGMSAGTLFYLPFAAKSFLPIATSPKYLALMFLVGIFSSILPFLVELTVMRYIATPVYALLVALYPATSILVGFVVLRQIPTTGELAGLFLITAAVALVNGVKESR